MTSPNPAFFDASSALSALSARSIPTSDIHDVLADSHDRAAMGRHRVYNFEVEGTHTYIAGGIRVHNQSILSFLSSAEIALIDPSSFQDQNGDGRLDYVELDFEANGNAGGSTVYKMETVNGQDVIRGYQTFTNAEGKLVQVQFTRDENGLLTSREIELTGAEFGERAGILVTPYLAAAILDEDASVFEQLVGETLIGTFVSNVFEFSGGLIHDQIVSNGMQNNSMEAIAGFTFGDIVDEFVSIGIDNVQNLLNGWILAEVFEGISTDTFGGRVLSALANQGVDYITDLGLHAFATNVLELDADQLVRFGIDTPTNPFTVGNFVNIVFNAAFQSLVPALESLEAQIVQGLTTLALEVFGGLTGPLGTVLGYVAGFVVDLIFDKDPEAYASLIWDEQMGQFAIFSTVERDGGDSAVATAMAGAVANFMNGFIEMAGASETNLASVSDALTLTLGHDEEKFRNGDGNNYSDAGRAVDERIIDILERTELKDGDLKFAAAIRFIIDGTFDGNAEEKMNELSMRLQIARDYDGYLNNQEAYDALIAASPESAYAAGWAVTFALAEQYGLTNAISHQAGAGDNMLRASSGDDLIKGLDGDDTIFGYLGADTLRGGEGRDTVHGGAGNDSISGNNGDDFITGGSGNDRIYGGGGNDEFRDNEGDDRYWGESGRDLITFSGSYVIRNVNGQPVEDMRAVESGGTQFTVLDEGNNNLVVTNRVTGEVDRLSGVEFLRFDNVVITRDPAYDNFVLGTVGDDLLEGTALRDAINGLEGDDVLYGFDGDDFLSGDAGDDTIFGGQGDDNIFGVLGNDLLMGGTGNDDIRGGSQEDYIWGDAGRDTVRGENGDDVLYGGSGDDSLDGWSGDDLIDGGDDRDIIIGGSGDDKLFGGGSNDTLSGGAGDDEIEGSWGFDSIDGDWGDDIIRAGTGNDWINGGGGDDLIYGDAGNDKIIGGWGDDTAYGGDGDDKIFVVRVAAVDTPFTRWSLVYEADGAAQFYNEWGQDFAYGGAGNDQIALNSAGAVGFGGSGNDTFFVSGIQWRVAGGTGYDTVQSNITKFYDIEWFKSASGQVGGKVWWNDSSFRHKDAAAWSLIVDVEKYVSASNGAVLLPGQSFRSDFKGNSKSGSVVDTGFQIMTDAAFEATFGEIAFENRRYMTRDVETVDGERAFAVSTGWEALTTGDDQYGDDSASDENLRGAQRLNAGNGNDSVYGGAGADQIKGEAGHDTLRGGSGADKLWGGSSNDRLEGGSGRDSLFGGTGNDSAFGGSGDDDITGETGADVLEGNEGEDTIRGGDQDDWISGGTGRDLIYGDDGNDNLSGDDAPDTINGGSGDDKIWGNDGGDNLIGGAGKDSLYGHHGVDWLRGGDQDDLLYGGDGKDSLEGGNHNDRLYGEAAADILLGGSGDDLLSGGSGDDSLVGGTGDDTLIGGTGADMLDGGANGWDEANYRGATSGIRIDLAAGLGFSGEALNDRFVGIDEIHATNHDDDITGNDENNSLFGYLGNDTLRGRDGDDFLDGVTGDDLLEGGAGDDRIEGGNGNDTLEGEFGNDKLFGEDGRDQLFGGAGNDSLYGKNDNDLLRGGDGADRLWGQNGNDDLRGEAGADTLDGGDGADTLLGGAGRDGLYGRSGDDQLDGGADADTVRGEAGNDQVSGGSGADKVYGDDGDDWVYGGSGADSLYGGNGADLLLGGAGIDLLNGGTGDDTLIADGDADVLTGGTGADQFVLVPGAGHVTVTDFENGTDLIGLPDGDYAITVASHSGGTQLILTPDTSIFLEGIAGSAITFADFFVANGDLALRQMALGTNGDDSMIGGDSVDRLAGGNGIDTLKGGGGADILSGGEGRDHIFDGDGDDLLLGGEGKDVFHAGAGADRYMGGDGRDEVYYRYLPAGVHADMTAIGGGGAARGDVFHSIERIHGTEYDDIIIVTDSTRAYGRGGDDILRDGAGTEMLHGGGGADRFVLTHGDGRSDLVLDFMVGVDTLDLSAWNVQSVAALEITAHSSSDLLVAFGADAVRLKGLTLGDTEALRASIDIEADWGDLLATWDAPVEGGGIVIDGTGAADLINEAFVDADGESIGNEGNVIYGGGGNDQIWDGDGNDLVYGQGGRNTFHGGDGHDHYIGGTDRDYFYGAAGADTYDGGEGRDEVRYFNSTVGVTVDMSNPGNSLGDAAGDRFIDIERLYGSDYDDVLTITGGPTQFTYGYGRDGDDVLRDGIGQQSLTGGNGADIFVFRAGDGFEDRILDFTLGEDQVDLKAWGVTDWEDLVFSTDSRDSRLYISFNNEVIRLVGLGSNDIGTFGSESFEVL